MLSEFPRWLEVVVFASYQTSLSPSRIQGRGIRELHLLGVEVGHARSQLPDKARALLVCVVFLFGFM